MSNITYLNLFCKEKPKIEASECPCCEQPIPISKILTEMKEEFEQIPDTRCYNFLWEDGDDIEHFKHLSSFPAGNHSGMFGIDWLGNAFHTMYCYIKILRKYFPDLKLWYQIKDDHSVFLERTEIPLDYNFSDI